MGKYRVLVRLIQFDHLMGKYKYAKPVRYGKWEDKYDASSIVDVVQNWICIRFGYIISAASCHCISVSDSITSTKAGCLSLIKK